MCVYVFCMCIEKKLKKCVHLCIEKILNTNHLVIVKIGSFYYLENKRMLLPFIIAHSLVHSILTKES